MNSTSKSIMKSYTLFSVLFLSAPFLFADTPVTEDFSVDENRHPGEDIGTYADWYVVPKDAVIVTDFEWVTDGQSVVVLPGTPVVEAVRYLPNDVDPLYLEVWIRPAVENGFTPGGIDVEGARVRFVSADSMGTVIGDGQAGEVSTGYYFDLTSDGGSDRWIDLSLEIRREDREWSLALDGEVVLEGLAAADDSFPGEAVFYGDEEIAVFFDALRIGSVPLSEFEQGTHGQDGEESSDVSDGAETSLRIADSESQGNESTGGTETLLGAGEGTIASMDTVYVDNIAGNDFFDGRAARADGGGGGPVASLSVALARVKDGGTIVIHEGAVYGGGMPNLNGKNVRIQTVGNVRVRSGS